MGAAGGGWRRLGVEKFGRFHILASGNDLGGSPYKKEKKVSTFQLQIFLPTCK